MSKRSFPLIAAFGVIASLAFVTPSHAGSIPFTYTTAITTSPPTITGTLFAGSAVSPPPSVTVTAVSPTTPTVAPMNPPLNSGNSFAFTIAGYTLANVPANSLYQISGTIDENVTIHTTSGSGTIQIQLTYFGFVGEGANTISPTIDEGTPSTTTIGPYNFSVFFSSTSTQASVPGSAINIALQATAVVPEPASMSLLGIGMAGFLAFRRFFNKRNADV
jgi:hypothetical protein